MFAGRTHSAFITLAEGEERFFRLPPASNGHVIVNAYHADVQLGPSPGGVASLLTPARLGTQLQLDPRPTLTIAQDKRTGPGDGGGSDTSLARNLELELRHGTHFSVRHGNKIIAESQWHDDFWRLRVRRIRVPNDLTPNPSQYRIEVSYTSQLPIVERRVPASFFHDGFEWNWNRQQYVYASVEGSKVIINYKEDLRSLYDLPTIRIETGVPLVEAHNIHTTSTRLDVGAGPSPRGGTALFFSVRVDFAADGEIIIPLLSDIIGPFKLPAFHFTVRLYLYTLGGHLEYVPVVESNLLDLLADVEIPDPELPNVLHTVNAKATAKKAIEDAIYQAQFPLQSGLSNFGQVLSPWLIGDQREIVSLDYAPRRGDKPSLNGIVEPAAGELIVRFVGRRARPDTQLVAARDGKSSGPIVEDGSVRLFDVPDEDPDPENPQPDTGDFSVPVGGGHKPSSGGQTIVLKPKVGALNKIDHIVVLMQENRSFDHVLGYLSRELGRTDVNGLNALPPDPQVNPQFNRFNNFNHYPQRAESTAWPRIVGHSGIVHGPCHETECVLSQIDNNMGRFVASFAERAGFESPHLGVVMNYFTADQLPVYDVLTREFGISDKWYTSHAGPTWPNRFVLLTGDLNVDPLGNVEQDNPDVGTLMPLQTPTLFDHLTERGASWRVFEHGYCFLRLYGKHTFDTTNIVSFDDPVRGFEIAARSGDLPQVTLIEPDYIDLPPGNDDHPPADMAAGQVLVNRIVQALIAGPAWERTMLVITYDEHGGFYDHVTPPTDAPPLRGGRRTLGPRVPTFVVSPLVKRGDVFEGRYDHTSIGATILRRFGGFRPPRISARLDAALDLRGTLKLDVPRPRSDFASIGLPPLSARSLSARSALRARRGRIASPQGRDDFHSLLSAIRLITGEALPHS